MIAWINLRFRVEQINNCSRIRAGCDGCLGVLELTVWFWRLRFVGVETNSSECAEAGTSYFYVNHIISEPLCHPS